MKTMEKSWMSEIFVLKYFLYSSKHFYLFIYKFIEIFAFAYEAKTCVETCPFRFRAVIFLSTVRVRVHTTVHSFKN